MNHSVLLIDDERWVRTALRRTIENTKLPFSVVHECGNGLEAVEWLKQNEVDLIFTDIQMPVMDGVTFAKQIREEGYQKDVIVISVHDEFHFVQKALRNGVSDYLLKPVEKAEMKKCLEDWMKKRSRLQEQDKQVQESVSTPLTPIEQVLQYMKETQLSKVSLTEAARRVHMNPRYLSQLFKQQIQVNFVDYLTELRMEEAKRLLSGTSLRISEISERLGYSDLAYFSNTFKKITGRSPSDFRKKEAHNAYPS